MSKNKKQRHANAWHTDMIQVTTSRLQNILTGCARFIILCCSWRRLNYLYVDIEEHAIPLFRGWNSSYINIDSLRYPPRGRIILGRHRFANDPNRLGRQHGTFQPKYIYENRWRCGSTCKHKTRHIITKEMYIHSIPISHLETPMTN